MTTTPSQPAADEREAFEKWVSVEEPGLTFERARSNTYRNSLIAWAWDAWQARAALSIAAPAGEPPRVDPMQDPKRPSFVVSYPDETPAEQVLRKLACWLGVGGYNAPTVDADVFHDKIVYAINELAAPAGEPAELQKIVFFFASVIKSGESWSPACEQALMMARGAAPAPAGDLLQDALDLAEARLEQMKADRAQALRWRDALNKIAERTGSDDPCRHLVQIARDALETRNDT